MLKAKTIILHGMPIQGTAAQYSYHSHLQKQGTMDRMRRLSDRAIACIALVFTFPLMFIVGLAIRLETPGPILARQDCSGCGGRRFQMLKFRTNVHQPERRTPAWAEQITGLGQLLRYTRIDALPQLFNVLRGEMSIIGSDAYAPSFLV